MRSFFSNQITFRRLSYSMSGLSTNDTKIYETAKLIIDSKECNDILQLVNEVKSQCAICFSNTDKTNNKTLFNAKENLEPTEYYEALEDLLFILKDQEFAAEIVALYKHVDRFDFEVTRANGVRSMIGLLRKCLAHLLSHIRQQEKHSFGSFTGSGEYNIISYINVLYELRFSLKILLKCLPMLDSNMKFTEDYLPGLPKVGSCDPVDPFDPLSSNCTIVKPTNATEQKKLDQFNDLLVSLDLIRQEHFYGRCMAFYMVPHAKKFFEAISSVLAGFADSFEKSHQGLFGAFNTMIHSVMSFWSPEERGMKIAQSTQRADIHLAKNFWGIAEHKLFSDLSHVVLPGLEVIEHVKLPNQKISVRIKGEGNELQVIQYPYPEEVNICILSNSPIDPSLYPDSVRHKKPPIDVNFEKKKFLVLHIHGGGFVSMSSKGHEVYLRDWVKKWECPVISVNYSLSPERVYPLALQQCFYAYCWVLENRERLGCTPDSRIVVCGDSAGGNLSAGLCLMVAAANLLEQPSGLGLIYTPLLLSFVSTPSKFMAYCDPLLPAGILARCLLAYNGIEEAKCLKEYFEKSGVEIAKEAEEIKLDEILTNSRISTLSRTRSYSMSDLPDCPISKQQNNNMHSNENLNKIDDSTKSKLLKTDNIFEESKSTSQRRRIRRMDPKNPMPHLRRLELRMDAYNSPILASDKLLSRLPPTTVMLVQTDVFLDEGIEFSRRLRKNNVPVRMIAFEDLPHGFLNFANFGPNMQSATKQCRDLIHDLLKGQLEFHKPCKNDSLSTDEKKNNNEVD